MSEVAENVAAVTASPAAEKKVKKSVSATKPKAAKANHPPCSEMVDAAISTLKERGGSSVSAIKKYVASTYKVDVEKLAPFIKKYVKGAVVKGHLLQTKGRGASGSFKLSAKVATKKTEKTAKKAAVASKPKTVAKKSTVDKKKPVAKKSPVKKAAATKKAVKSSATAAKKSGTVKAKPAAVKPKVAAVKPKKAPTVKKTASPKKAAPTKVKKPVAKKVSAKK